MDEPLAEVFDHAVDILVVGSGNAGLVGALAARGPGDLDVLVIEKQAVLGGTSAASGGGVWIPCNRYAREAGAEDSVDAARRYLEATIPPHEFDAALIETYLAQGPAMVDFLHDQTRARYASLPSYPDYFSEAPGMRDGHRSMEPLPIALTELGDDAAYLHEPNPMTLLFGRVAFTQEELHLFVTQSPGWIQTFARQALAYAADWRGRLRVRRSRRLTLGAAGVARLLLSVRDAGIPVWRATPLRELILEGGRVVGAEVERAGSRERIRARRGVLLACGGFEHNQAMREAYLPAPTDSRFSAGSTGNEGDGIEAARRLGAELRGMQRAWWCSTLRVPGECAPRLSIFEKSMPGNYTVNRAGRRIANESQNYQLFVRQQHERHKAGEDCDPLFMVFDAEHRRKYPVGPLLPGKFLPDALVNRNWFSSGFVTRAQTLAELAEKTGIDAVGLEETAKRVCDFARQGKDPDFDRGASVHDRHYGDPACEPNPCLGPLSKPPFYAIRIDPGDFGTAGGLATDARARVLSEAGAPIPGLYAAGNCAAGILTTYPGPGATLGPAMVFGFIAGRELATDAAVDEAS